MKNKISVIAILAMTLLVAACNNSSNTANTAASTATTAAATNVADNSIKKGLLKKVSSKEIIEKFGLAPDFLNEKGIYNTTYEYKTAADGKEILHGNFAIKTAETEDEFVARNFIKGTTAIYKDEENKLELSMSFTENSFEGQFSEGLKTGKMLIELNGYENGGKGFIIFEANKPVSAKYDGGEGGGECLSYEGPVKLGTLKELWSLVKTVDC